MQKRVKRDYAKENARKKELNRRYGIVVEKDLAEMLDYYLKKDNLSVTSFFKEKAYEYIKSKK